MVKAKAIGVGPSGYTADYYSSDVDGHNSGHSSAGGFNNKKVRYF